MEHSPNTSYGFCIVFMVTIFSAIRFPMLLMSHLSQRISTARKRHLFFVRCVLVAHAFIPRQLLTIICTGRHSISRVEVQSDNARRLDCSSWRRRRSRTSWFALLLVTIPVSPQLCLSCSICRSVIWTTSRGDWSVIHYASSACFSLCCRLQIRVRKRKSCASVSERRNGSTSVRRRIL